MYSVLRKLGFTETFGKSASGPLDTSHLLVFFFLIAKSDFTDIHVSNNTWGGGIVVTLNLKQNFVHTIGCLKYF